MKVYIRPRMTGKTIYAIKRSAAKQIPIVVRDRATADLIKKKSKEMELDIPNPIGTSEIASGKFKGVGLKNVIVDDAEFVLPALLKWCIGQGLSVDTMMFSTEGASFEFPLIGEEE